LNLLIAKLVEISSYPLFSQKLVGINEAKYVHEKPYCLIVNEICFSIISI
jgi:hypothetical protein